MITKQQWQTDIENTKKELEAFRKIYEGYETIGQLPENQESGKSLFYRVMGQVGSLSYFSIILSSSR